MVKGEGARKAKIYSLPGVPIDREQVDAKKKGMTTPDLFPP